MLGWLVALLLAVVMGFGSFVLHHLALRGMLDHGLKVRPMVLRSAWEVEPEPPVPPPAAAPQQPAAGAIGTAGAREPSLGRLIREQMEPLRDQPSGRTVLTEVGPVGPVPAPVAEAAASTAPTRSTSSTPASRRR